MGQLFSLRWPPPVAAVVLMVSAVAARPPATNGWQQIIFSSPDNTEISSNLTSTANRPSSSGLEGKLQLFQDSSPVAAFATPPPSGAPSPMPSRSRRFEKSSQDNRPWEFMTPAEILGVAPDQSLQKPDAQSAQGSLTPMERYLQGQSSFSRFRTNSAGNSFRGQNLRASDYDQTNGASPGFFSGMWDNVQSNVSRPFLGNAPDNNLPDGPNEDSIWQKMFGSQAARPTYNPDRPQSDMSQFMQLLNPGSTPAAAASAPEETPSFKPQTTWPSSDSTVPLANSIGASFAPMSSDISRPTGPAPLPSITRPTAVQAAAPAAWAPQPPPWLSSTPQPFAVPQRKF